ncbi:MAG TPA: sigma 54-interacting transcriptional regulator [bacterium]|nr:sigma 54-interacting transcriptional regulator [bacterium]
MAAERLAPIQALKQRLAEARNDAERLGALRDLSNCRADLTSEEFEACLREFAEVARRTRSLSDLVRAGLFLSETCRDRGDVGAARECALLVHEAALASENPVHEGQYLYLVGRSHEVEGDYEPARECYERALGLFRRAGDSSCVVAALNQLGNLAVLQGQVTEALQHFQDCLELDDELADTASRALHQHNIGCALQRLGRLDDALESYYRGLSLSEEHAEARHLRPAALNSLGEIFLERDKVAKAVSMFTMALRSADPTESPPYTLLDATSNLGQAYHRQGSHAAAHRAYSEALALAQKSDAHVFAAQVLWRMAELALDMGECDRCRELAERSRALARKVGLQGEEAQSLRVMALLHAVSGEDRQTRECFEQSMVLLHDLEESSDLARVRFHYGRYLFTRGEHEAAMSHLKAASRTFRALGIIAEGHDVNRLLFQRQLDMDSDMALLQGVSALASMKSEPQVFLNEAIGMLLEALRFDSAAILVGGRTLLMRGRPDLKPSLGSGVGEELIATNRMLSWPVRHGGSVLGRVHLERAEPLALEHNHLVLGTIANLLATPIHRLSELTVRVVEESPGLAGLRYQGVVGRNQRMLDVLAAVCAAASRNDPVLIRGEIGSGKELIARALHDSGIRAGMPFASVNCAAIPENLLESELLGVGKAGAPGSKGRLGLADGGTLFLDEIGAISLAQQSKLMRVLREHALERAGGSKPVSIDVRVVVGTSQPLDQLVAQSKFREDLCEQLGAVELVLPPLRERPEDIPELVRHFVRRSSLEFGRDLSDISPEAMTRLTAYRWSGNVRELERVIERSVLLARGGTIQLDDLPPSLQAYPSEGAQPS